MCFKHMWLFAFYSFLKKTDINKKALIPKNQGFFLVVTPTGFEPVLPP